jgi:predicted regulator of Ras-like GTPase activity (Roadblock/LC7/MglB family)
MEITKRTGLRIAAFAAVALVLPLLVFPRQFGTDLAKGSLVNALYELVYFGMVMFLMNRRASLPRVVQASGVCLIFRLGIGAVFGLLVAVIYSMKLSVSLQMGTSNYLPAILFHIAVTPFVLWPALASLLEHRPRRRRISPEVTEARGLEASGTSIAISKERGIVSDSQMPTVAADPETDRLSKSTSQDSVQNAPISDTSGFERATSYIGEHGSVHLAAVVDEDGLLLSNFRRGEVDPEAWAPMALLLMDSNQQILERITSGRPEKIDVTAGANRIVIVRQSWYSLVVLAERQTDDFLHIRINQGMEIIRKYVEERYSHAENYKAEKTYV